MYIASVYDTYQSLLDISHLNTKTCELILMDLMIYAGKKFTKVWKTVKTFRLVFATT